MSKFSTRMRNISKLTCREAREVIMDDEKQLFEVLLVGLVTTTAQAIQTNQSSGYVGGVGFEAFVFGFFQDLEDLLWVFGISDLGVHLDVF